jgi:hypothetical protein
MDFGLFDFPHNGFFIGLSALAEDENKKRKRKKEKKE